MDRTLHIGSPQYRQGLHSHNLSNKLRWLPHCLLNILLFYCLMQPTLLFADNSLVTQEIRYHMSEAGEVLLVWGIDGWQMVAEETRPIGTVVDKRGVMSTPMVQVGETFVTKIQVPSNATIEYGFLITKKSNGTHIKALWDGDQNYQMIASADGLVEVETAVTLAQDQASANIPDRSLVTQEIRYYMPDAGEVFLVWGINGWYAVPEKIRPTGTVVKEGLMHTLMAQEGDAFVAKVRVPVGTTVDYGFLITDRRGIFDVISPVWDGDQDYQITVSKNGVVEVKTMLVLAKELPEVLDNGRYFLAGSVILLGTWLLIFFFLGILSK